MSTVFVTASDDSQKALNNHINGVLRAANIAPVLTYRVNSWWDKPKVLQIALIANTKAIWVDNDVEILDDQWFDIINAEPVSLCVDLPMTNLLGTMQYNTGVVVMDRPGVKAWVNALDETERSDQECFPVDIVTEVLDPRFNSLRLNPIAGAYATHWTGQSKWDYAARLGI